MRTVYIIKNRLNNGFLTSLFTDSLRDTFSTKEPILRPAGQSNCYWHYTEQMAQDVADGLIRDFRLETEDLEIIPMQYNPNINVNLE